MEKIVQTEIIPKEKVGGIKEALVYSLGKYTIEGNSVIVPGSYYCSFGETEGNHQFTVLFEVDEMDKRFKGKKLNLWRHWQFRELRKSISDIEGMLDCIPEYIEAYS